MSSAPYSEKRNERRFPINSVVNITLPNKRTIKGVCCNISGSGMPGAAHTILLSLL